MNTVAPLLIALCSVAAFQAAATEACIPLAPGSEAQTHPSFTRESATVEDVLSTIEDGYRSRAYIVTWHGSRILVSDPLAESEKSVGDSVDFLASRDEVSGDRILAFISTERGPSRTAGASGSSSFEASSTTSTGVVEEVLSARENGFRFTAYIVRSHDQQLAVSDPLALSRHGIGEQIDYLTLRTSSRSGPLLSFQVQLSAAEKASISKPLCGIQSSLETGVVDQVLSTRVDDYEYRAYVVEWRGSQIVLDDSTPSKNYQAGDSVSFWISRSSLPPDNHKLQWFTFDRPAHTTVINQSSDLQTSSARDSAPVQAVLASEVDGYRSVAYLVNWHNTPVAIEDAFATTHFATGDRITFSVARTTTPDVKELNFMLFAFPDSPCARKQLSGDNSAAVATAKSRGSGCRS